MRQRVVIALALCADPRLIIADEPTTALDVSIQAQIIALLKKLCREHKTAVMLITHDMGVIAETADRVAVMYSGRVAEIGPVKRRGQATEAPLHRRADGLRSRMVGHDVRAPYADRRCDAAAERNPGGLRLQPALSQGLRPVPYGASRADARRDVTRRAACWQFDRRRPGVNLGNACQMYPRRRCSRCGTSAKRTFDVSQAVAEHA